MNLIDFKCSMAVGVKRVATSISMTAVLPGFSVIGNSVGGNPLLIKADEIEWLD